MSVFSIKTWLEKGYTEEEAKYQVAIRRPSNILYYINKGFSEEESVQMLKEHQSKCGIKRKNMSELEKRTLSPRCVEFYLAKGMTQDQAQEAVAQFQTSFSKEKCVERYGEEEGLRVFIDRQARWQDSLNRKTEEEKNDINKRKNRWINLDEEQYASSIKHISKKLTEMWESRTAEEISELKFKVLQTKLNRGLILDPSLKSEFEKYRSDVMKYTRNNDLTLLENYDKRGITDYHVDHKYSVQQGFINGVDAKIIGHRCNLEMLHYKDNVSKHTDCSITLEELLELIKAQDD